MYILDRDLTAVGTEHHDEDHVIVDQSLFDAGGNDINQTANHLDGKSQQIVTDGDSFGDQ